MFREPDGPPSGGPRPLILIVAGSGIILLSLILIAASLAIFWPEDNNDTPPDSAPRIDAVIPTDSAQTLVPGTSPTPGEAAPVPTHTPAISPTPYPTLTPQPTMPPVDWAHPTAAPNEIAAALDVPVGSTGGSVVMRDIDPLTILPARSRSTVITYRVQKDDNLAAIADMFGLEQNTIIWSNDSFYVNAMRVDMELTILPVDGVYHRTQEPQTVTEIAAQYDVDPYVIIDSEYNTLFGATADTVLPVGLYVVVPGGTGSKEPVYWDPGIVMTTESGTSGSGAVAGTNYASFAVGDPGSCGRQAVVGGSPPYTAPIWRNYTITQDFTWNHGGIDLAVPEGTQVYAAGGGTVIFSGWSTWGYGYTVVLAHGGTLSLYGHLNGAFVSCGEVVTAGQNIAVSGNSGRSSGPHLHFEIRGSNGAPDNPWNYQSF